jgi:hypothetical protein
VYVPNWHSCCEVVDELPSTQGHSGHHRALVNDDARVVRDARSTMTGRLSSIGTASVVPAPSRLWFLLDPPTFNFLSSAQPSGSTRMCDGIARLS